MKALEQRARRHGVPNVLLERGGRLRNTAPLAVRIAFYRLLTKVASGDLTKLRYLVDIFRPEPPSDQEMWALISLAGFDVAGLSPSSERSELIDRLAGPIRAEFLATSESTIFTWLTGKDVYKLNDPQLNRIINLRLSSALQRRYLVDAPPPPPNVVRDRLSVIRSVSKIDGHQGGSVFIAGATLLAVETGRAGDGMEVMEFGTFSSLDTVRASLAAGSFVVDRSDEFHVRVRHAATEIVSVINKYSQSNGRVHHGTSVYTRWHTPFQIDSRVADGTPCFVPTNVGLYLSERFGNWATPTLFYDDLLDAPNTIFNETLEAMFALYRRASQAYTNSTRFFADETAEQLKHRFGVDFTMYVPQPVHPKVLSMPLPPEPDGRCRAMAVGSFDSLNAEFLTLLTSCAAKDTSLIAAIHKTPGTRDAAENMALARTLKRIDHVVSFGSVSELVELVKQFGVRQLFLDKSSGFTTSWFDSADLPTNCSISILEDSR